MTASYDLSFDQLDDLLARRPAGWLEVVIHQQIPMFHMEHCVFCAFLSPGPTRPTAAGRATTTTSSSATGSGMEHPLKADVGCRNTLFNAVPQTAAEYLPRLIAAGPEHLRVEFLDDDPGLRDADPRPLSRRPRRPPRREEPLAGAEGDEPVRGHAGPARRLAIRL